ncbi:TIM barrel protein [Mesorhizobium sp. M1340]|uniref:hypothetical protein n=1 Tax=Mesorhizobium sp. M1340 TaxID=2957087 RepID=UPI0033373803
MSARLTILNSMAGDDFASALDQHQAWGLSDLDLRDGIYGHWLASLPKSDAMKAEAQIRERGLSVHCLSTSIFYGEIGNGRDAFCAEHIAELEHIISLIDVFQPKFVRLLAPQLSARPSDDTAIEVMKNEYPWVFDLFRDAIGRIRAAGASATIENEAWHCVLSRPREFTQFFDELGLGDAVKLTWDVQNQWATGVFPSLETLNLIEPLVAYYHVKGGQHADESRRLSWNVALEDASWPIGQITQEVVARGLSPVICINPAQHGQDKPDYDYQGIVERDIAFMRTIKGIV